MSINWAERHNEWLKNLNDTNSRNIEQTYKQAVETGERERAAAKKKVSMPSVKTYSSPAKDTIVQDTINMLNKSVNKQAPAIVKQPTVKTNIVDYLTNSDTIKKANAGEFKTKQTISKPDTKTRLQMGLSDLGNVVKAGAYGLGEGVGVNAIDKAIEKGVFKEKDFTPLALNTFLDKKEGTVSKTENVAKNVGNVAGSVIQMLGLGALSGGVSSKIGNSILKKVTERTLTGAGMGAISSYENNQSGKEALKNIGRNALFMNAGGAASDLTGLGGTKLLEKMPVPLRTV